MNSSLDGGLIGFAVVIGLFGIQRLVRGIRETSDELYIGIFELGLAAVAVTLAVLF